MVSEKIAPVPWIRPVFLSPGAQLARPFIGSIFLQGFFGNDTATMLIAAAAATLYERETLREVLGWNLRLRSARLPVARRRSFDTANARDSARHVRAVEFESKAVVGNA